MLWHTFCSCGLLYCRLLHILQQSRNSYLFLLLLLLLLRFDLMEHRVLNQHVCFARRYSALRHPFLWRPHQVQQNSISGLTVDDLLLWLQNVPKCRDVQLLVVHVGVNTVTESMWRALLKLLKSVFPNAVVQLSSLIPPQGEHP